jgi:hypothetical protein
MVSGGAECAMPLGDPGMIEPAPPGNESLAIRQNDGKRHRSVQPKRTP